MNGFFIPVSFIKTLTIRRVFFGTVRINSGYEIQAICYRSISLFQFPKAKAVALTQARIPPARSQPIHRNQDRTAEGTTGKKRQASLELAKVSLCRHTESRRCNK